MDGWVEEEDKSFRLFPQPATAQKESETEMTKRNFGLK